MTISHLSIRWWVDDVILKLEGYTDQVCELVTVFQKVALKYKICKCAMSELILHLTALKIESESLFFLVLAHLHYPV